MEETINLDEFTEEELEVARILVDLKEIHRKHWYFDPWTPKSKRRRGLVRGPPPPIQQIQEAGGGGVGSDGVGACGSLSVAGSEPPKAAAAVVDSPNSTLEFSAAPGSTEVEEEKPEEEKTIMVISKSSRELKLEKKIEELTQGKEVLTGELERVMKFHKKLKDYNSLLKTKKEETKEPETKTSSTGMDLRHEMSQFYKRTMVIIPPRKNHPYVPDPTAPGFRFPSGPPSTREHAAQPNNGLKWAGPRGFDFDLNLPPADEEEACTTITAAMKEQSPSAADQSQPSDENMEMDDPRARCAEARRRRMCMMRIKSMRSARSIKSSTTNGS